MSDYLWDPSAEADPDVKEFEEALSAMRCRVGGTELPERLEHALLVRRSKRPSRLLAAAAVLTFMLLASGVWLSRQSYRRHPGPAQVAVSSEDSGRRGGSTEGEESVASSGSKQQEMSGAVQLQKPEGDMQMHTPLRKGVRITRKSQGARGPSANRPAGHATRARGRPATNALSGEAAKAQIMLALQITSAKLSQAHRMARRSATP